MSAIVFGSLFKSRHDASLLQNRKIDLTTCLLDAKLLSCGISTFYITRFSRSVSEVHLNTEINANIRLVSPVQSVLLASTTAALLMFKSDMKSLATSYGPSLDQRICDLGEPSFPPLLHLTSCTVQAQAYFGGLGQVQLGTVPKFANRAFISLST